MEGFIAQIILNGVMLSSLYCLVAVGLALVFGVMRVINFAHGELYMLGAYSVWLVYAEYHLPFWVAVLVAGLGIGVLGVILERCIFRFLRDTPMMGLLASLGLAFIFQVLVLIVFGAIWKQVPPVFSQTIHIFGASISMQRLFVIFSGFTLLVLLGVFLQRTKPGLAIIACAEDSQAAALQGMSLNTTSAMTMFIGCGLAGIAGALASPILPVDPWMGGNMIMKAFIVVIVGGVGNITGALLVALVLGFLESSLTTLVNPMLSLLIELVVMLLILTFRPQGLFGYE